MPRFIAITLILCAVMLLGGCSPSKKLHPVKGAVVFEDGTSVKELAGGHVSFEALADQSNASGEIDGDGNFHLLSPLGADGVPAGKYRVLVMPPEPRDPDHPATPILLDRYRSYERSGLEVIVEEKANIITIKLQRK